MGNRDREFGRGRDRGGEERERYGQGRYRDSGRESYGDRPYNENDPGSTYERSRGREHLGEFPRGGEYGRGERYASRDRGNEDLRGAGGSRGSERGRDYRGEENRNPYYGGGGLFGGGMGGYTGGGYLGGGLERSAIDNETEEERAYRRQNFRDREQYDARNYRGGRGDERDDPRRGGRHEEEGWFDRMTDTVSSWLGGDDDRESYRERSHRGRGPRNYTRSDDRIREDINDRLTDHHAVDASDIDVEVSSGEVVLTGHVGSRYEKRLAEDITEDVSGVRNVENRIRVQQQNRWGSNYTHTGTGGAMTAGSGLGTESPGGTTSAENTGTSTTGTERGRSAGGTG